jgi:VWFA-related protein
MKAILAAAVLLSLPEQLPQPPTFKSGVNVVEVDVVVTDKSGRPVRGLRQEDFEICEDGKPVDIMTFTVVDVPEMPPSAEIPPADRSGTSFASNDQLHDGRVILIVLDDYHVAVNAGRISVSKSIARRLVERLGPSDHAAVIGTSSRNVAPVEFTADKARLIEAIDRFVPQSEQGTSLVGDPSGTGAAQPPMDFSAEARARRAMDTMSHAAGILAMIPHRRKAVRLVSQGLPMSLGEILANPNAEGAALAMREFILIAQRSNVAVYPVDPCGLELGSGCSKASRENLRTIAESTGAFAVTNTNAPEAGVDRMLAENGAYYLVGYSSPARADDGKRHQIKVRTQVPDVVVRARAGYVSLRKAAKPAPSPSRLDALIGVPIQTRGLTMRVVAIPTPLATEPFAAVVLGVELPTSQAGRSSHIDFSAVAIDTEGRIRARLRFTTRFAASGATATGWTRTGSRIDVRPGQYQIKVAAVAADGMQGSVFTDVTVPEFGGDIGVGGLSLGASTPPVGARADRLIDALSLAPFASRELFANADVAAQLPIRVSSKARSRPLTLAAMLVRPDGTTLELDKASLPAVAYATPSGKVYRLSLPRELSPGVYRLIVETTLERTRVVRELTFRIISAP